MFYTLAECWVKGRGAPQFHDAHFPTILGVSAVYQVKPAERTQAGNITFNKRSGEEGPF